MNIIPKNTESNNTLLLAGIAIAFIVGLSANVFEHKIVTYGYTYMLPGSTVWGVKLILSGLSILMLAPVFLVPNRIFHFGLAMPLIFVYMIFTMSSASTYEEYARHDDSHLVKSHLTAIYPAYTLEAEGSNESEQMLDDWYRDVGQLLQELATSQKEFVDSAINKALDTIAKEAEKNER